MPLLTALALTIGGFGGILTYLCLGPLAFANLQIWAIFLGAASFFGLGGKEAGLKAQITQNFLGVLTAWIALVLVTQTALAAAIGLPAAAGIFVAITAGAFVLAANMPMFAAIPFTVPGYASTAAIALLAGAAGKVLEPTVANPAIAAGLSLLIGGGYGYVCEKVTGMLVAAPVPAKA
jgi:hypothetical protein